jgi:Nif-specific regulatory protein
MMAHQDDLEHYEATEAQDLTRLLHALRPSERAVQVPPPVDLTIRAAIWQAPVRRQVITLLSMTRRDLIQVIRQALMENPMLEEVAHAEDEHTPADGAHVLRLTASADELMDAEERYDSIWQACMSDGWDASGLPAPASEAPSAPEHSSSPHEALVPDVIVTQVGQEYQVVLHEEGLPQLRLRATDRRLVREGQGGEPETMHYLDDKLRAAVWLIRSLEYRHQTLSTVAQSLVTRQRAFLDHGLAHLTPLALTEVAAALDLHAWTVRRVVTNTYLATAHGIVALTSFFQSGIESYGGETMSSLTVKDRIKKLVAAEDPAKPLTDQQLVEVLAAEHIKIARRTVTTYRRELKLPPANRRQPHGSTAGASRFSSDEEQRVRQALEAHARRRQAEPPPQRDREETSGIPPEVQEAQHHRDQEALAWLHLQGIEWWRLVADPEVRAAYRDLQTALAHPPLRPAVLLALRAFAQAAQAGETTPPAADAVEPVPRLQERPNVEALSSIHDLDHLLKRAIERVVTRLDIENASIILLDEERDELYFAKVADESRVGHEKRLSGVRFPATQGIAGWVIREGHSLIVPDVDNDPRFYRGIDVHTSTQTRSLVCVPLRTQARIIGVLEAMNKRQGPFTVEDVRQLEAFAHELARALEQARAIQERYSLDVQPLIAEAERLAHSAVLVDPLLGESPTMQEVARLVERVLNTTATVLLTGERGTGQDRIARLLHDQGPRAKGPFMTVNCAAIPETRLEAELFGDERGAFIGATQRQPGRLELAAGGTLFLDEIDALSPALQAKLLRVLHERTFTHMGGTDPLTTDARIIAATHEDLARLVAEGRFRPDLFYRLNVYPIRLPPLRERPEDLRALTMLFLKRYGHEGRKEVLGMSEDAMGWLERYPWPGNVRELDEVIEGAVARCQGPTVTVQDLPQASREQSRAPGSYGDAFRLPPGGIDLRELEKDLIRQALEQAHQNKSQAAKLLGLSRTQLRVRMRLYGLE